MNKIKLLKKLSLGGFMLLTFISIYINAYAFSGLLDTYAGSNFSHVGAGAKDDFNTSGTIKIQHWTDFFNGKKTGMELYAEQKLWWGGYGYPTESQFVYGTGYKFLEFKLPKKATYRLHFRTTSNNSTVTFHGKVWDYY